MRRHLNYAVRMNGDRSRLGCFSAHPRAEHRLNAPNSERVYVRGVAREARPTAPGAGALPNAMALFRLSERSAAVSAGPPGRRESSHPLRSHSRNGRARHGLVYSQACRSCGASRGFHRAQVIRDQVAWQFMLPNTRLQLTASRSVPAPTGLSPKAQGCRHAATLGSRPTNLPNRNAVAASLICADGSDICQNPVRVSHQCNTWTQGSRWRSNLGLAGAIPLGLWVVGASPLLIAPKPTTPREVAAGS
jgi:hypothetical protein